MKKLLLLLFLVAGTTMAQTGYVATQALLASMPEYQTANEQIVKMQESLRADLEKANANVKQKFADLQYKAQAPGVTEAQMQDFSNQAKNLEAEIARESKLADLKLAAERNKLLDPLTKKLNDAIKKIADAKGLKVVIDISAIAYATEDGNITLDVAKELGIPLEGAK